MKHAAEFRAQAANTHTAQGHLSEQPGDVLKTTYAHWHRPHLPEDVFDADWLVLARVPRHGERIVQARLRPGWSGMHGGISSIIAIYASLPCMHHGPNHGLV